jgi:hypothetical protein
VILGVNKKDDAIQGGGRLAVQKYHHPGQVNSH